MCREEVYSVVSRVSSDVYASEYSISRPTNLVDQMKQRLLAN